MFNSVEFVRTLCQERKIAISKLEKDLGYGNGYFNAKKQAKIPYDRAVEIAKYLSVSPELILTGKETEKAPTNSGERSVSDDDIKFALFGGDGEITDAMYEEVRKFAAFVKQREADKKKE